MKCNVGNGDRIFRGIVGIVVISIGIYYQSWWGAVGLVLLLTSAFRFCPAFWLVKFSSAKKEAFV